MCVLLKSATADDWVTFEVILDSEYFSDVSII